MVAHTEGFPNYTNNVVPVPDPYQGTADKGQTAHIYPDLYTTFAAIIGKSARVLLALENGYYWDSEKEEVVPGLVTSGETPEFNRTGRRALNAAARKGAKADTKKERKNWLKLYGCLETYTEKYNGQPAHEDVVLPNTGAAQENQTLSSEDVVPQQHDEYVIPQEDRSTHTTDLVNEKDVVGTGEQCNPMTVQESAVEHVPTDGQEDQSSHSEDSKDVVTNNDVTERIRSILTMLSPNGILRFLLWSIREIADEMAKDPELRKKYILSEHAFTRDRAILLSDVLLFLMTMAGDNMNNEVYEYFKMDRVHPSTPAMVQRRGLLTAAGVEYFLGRITNVCIAICDNLPGQLNKDQVLSAFSRFLSVDGSGINVAYDPDNKETYMPGKNGKKGYNQYHLNSIRDSVNGIFVANILQPVNQLNETRAAIEMIRSIELTGRNLFTGDRGYASLNLIETIRRKPKLDLLIRVKESWIKETSQLPLEELDTVLTIHVVTTQRNEDKVRFKNGTAKYLSGKSKFGKYKKSQTWDYESEVDVTFRVVRFQLDSGVWETLVTTLDASEFSIDDLKKLYFMRWSNIENAFRTLKWDTHLSQMHCKLDNSSRQEIFARLAMHNIVSCIIRVANSLEPVIRKIKSSNTNSNAVHDTKNPLIINRRFATHLVCDFFKNADAIAFDVIEVLLRNKVPVRSGRSFKRNMRIIGFVSYFYR